MECDNHRDDELFWALRGALGAQPDTGKLLDELVARVGVDPTSAVLEHGSYRETKRYLAEHGPGEDRPLGHLFSKSEFFRRSLPGEVIEALVAGFQRGRVAGQARELDFTPWGGAYNRVPADAPTTEREGRTALAGALMGNSPPVGVRRGVPELPRSRPGGLGARLPREQPRPPAARQAALRPGEFLPVPAVGHLTAAPRAGGARRAGVPIPAAIHGAAALATIDA